MKYSWIVGLLVALALGAGCSGQMGSGGDLEGDPSRDAGLVDASLEDATGGGEGDASPALDAALPDSAGPGQPERDAQGPGEPDGSDDSGGADEPDSAGEADDVEEESGDPPEDPGPGNDCPNVKVEVDAGLRLYIRAAPNTDGDPVGELYRDSVVRVVDEVQGESVDGETLWYEIESSAGDGYITARYVSCTTDSTEINDCPNVKVTTPASMSLNIRSAANSSSNVVGKLNRGMVVSKVGEVQGESVDGNTLWYEIESLAGDGYISAAWAECTTEAVLELGPPDGFYLPLECGVTATISQGNNGSFSHTGLHRYAWDFAVPLRTPLVAIADGIVTHTYSGTAPGSACDGGGQSCVQYANHVVLLHGDNTLSTYRHLTSVSVSIGEFVPRGTAVGLSGQTGWSTGPHAHVMRMSNCGSAFPPSGQVCQSIATSFEDHAANGGVPAQGASVTSGNCP